MRIPELCFHCGVSFFVYVLLFLTRDFAGLVSTTYLMGCCDIIPIQP